MFERSIPVIEDKIKKYTYITSEVPTTDELENIKEARKRVLLVIKTRWALLGVFFLFGLYSAFFYSLGGTSELSPIHKAVPVAAFIIAVAYNSWYHYSYRWFSNIRRLNLIQILFDLLFVTIIVHFSGGAVSWFWAMYFVLILEAAFLGEGIYDAWVIGICSSLFYGALLTAEFYGKIPSVKMPFENNFLQQNFQYEMIKWAWVSVVCLLVSGIGSYLMKGMRNQESMLKKMIITDSLTGMYNRWYFHVRLNSELQRAKRYGRTFSLLILDVDDFKKFNDTYGHQTGDILLAGVAKVVMNSVRRNDSIPQYDIDIPCRVGGEEFGIILPEASTVESSVAGERLRASIESRGAAIVGERIRTSIESYDIEGKKVTVCVGIASFPEHGTDMNSLYKAADDAMYLAKKRGKNRVVIANTQTV